MAGIEYFPEEKATTFADLYADNDLQQEILDDLADCGLDPDEQAAALRDLASGHDPIYQFFGMIVTYDHIERTYSRLKTGIIDQLTHLQECGMDVRDYMRREAFDNAYANDPQHIDWICAALKAAVWSAAGDLVDQLDS